MTTPNPMLEIAAKALYDSEHERSIHADQIIARAGNREFKDTMEPYAECADSCWRVDAIAVFKALAAAPLDERVVEAAARATIESTSGPFEMLDDTGRDAARYEARAALRAAFSALTASG